jgi:hypothetical protein
MFSCPCRGIVDIRDRVLAHLSGVDTVARISGSTSLGVLQRAQLISSQGKPPLTAWSMVGDGSIGSPSLHIRSFQLSQRSRSACWMIASPLARISTDWAARMLAIARALPSSFARALRSPPDNGVG